jgi:hypothetical protein
LVATPLLAIVAACGGGGGGGGGTVTPAPLPKTAVFAVSSPVASQAAAGQSQLVFRATLLAEPTFPVDMSFSITGATGGSSCAAGVDYVVAPAANVSATPAATTSGVLALASAASERLVTVQVCPGSGATDKTLALHWADPSHSGDAVGTVRATANLAIDKSKRLNDTGITACANGSSNAAACPQTGFAGQDAEHGRDVSVAITGLGANRGSAFALSSLANGACVQDNVTGLVWEGKTTSGLHAAASTYTWLASTGANGGAAGTSNGGVCTGSGCDTEKFIAAVNAEATCGFTDWRLPTADELGGIVDAGATVAPAIRPQFANQAAAAYWSASPKAGDSAGAWALDFNSGAIGALAKSTASRIRLVRGH